MNVVRASNSAADREIAAKRSPIGKAMIFLIQRPRRERSILRHAPRRRCLNVGGGGAAAGSPSGTSGAGTAVANMSCTCSSGGCRAAPIAWCWAAG